MSMQNIFNRIGQKFDNIKQITHTQQGKEILTFLAFVVLATGIWFILAINDNRENIIQIPIELTNVPEETVLLQDMPPYVQARIRDKGAALLSYNINGLAPIKIDFNRHNNQRDLLTISNSALIEYARRELRPTTIINDFTPDSIRIAYTNEQGKRLPVAINADIATSLYSTLSDSIYTIPDTVTIYGKASQISRLQSLLTEEIVAHNIIDTTYIRARLQPIEGTRIIPDSITIVIPAEEYTTKTLTVPISIGGIPAHYSVMTFPSHITLTCLVPKSKYATIVSDDFLVGNTFDNIQQTPGAYGAIEVANAPDYALNITLSTDSIEYIISESITHTIQQSDTTTQQP